MNVFNLPAGVSALLASPGQILSGKVNWRGGHDLRSSANLLRFQSQLYMKRKMTSTLAYGHSGKPKLLEYDLERLINLGGLSNGSD